MSRISKARAIAPVKAVIFLARGLFRLLEWVFVKLGNLALGARGPKHWARNSSSDLLKAHRLAQYIREGDAVLDVGCGTGRTLAQLALFRGTRSLGVDLSLARLEYQGVMARVFDGRRLPFPRGDFDVTLICNVLHHLSREHAEALLGEALRVTRRTLLITEDSLPRFSLFYRLRNRFHRLDTELEYASESGSYRAPEGDGMFLSHGQWLALLGALPGVEKVELRSLEDIMPNRHHALFVVTRKAAAQELHCEHSAWLRESA